MKIAVRSTPSTSQKRSGEPSRSLIRLVAPDRDDEEEADREQQREEDRQAPGEAADLLRLPPRRPSCALAEIARARKPIFSDSAEGDDAADHGQPRGSGCRLAQETMGSDVISISPSGVRHGDRPDGDAAHHHALEHRLAADRRVADARPAGRRASRSGLGYAGSRARWTWRVGLRAQTGALGGAAAGTARRGRRCQPASACPCRRGGTASRSPREARAPWSGYRTRSRTSSGRARGRSWGGYLSSSHSSLAGDGNTAGGCRKRRSVCASLTIDIQPVGQLYIQPVCEFDPSEATR